MCTVQIASKPDRKIKMIASNFRRVFLHGMMTVVAYWRVETIVSKYSHCRILSKFWRPKNLGHERRRRLNKSQPSQGCESSPPPRVFFSFQKSYLIWDLPDMICADKNKKTILSFVVYRLQATQCNTEQLLKRFFDFLNVKIRVGKGEDTRTTNTTSDLSEAASASQLLLLASATL